MKEINIAIVFILLFSVTSCGQVKNTFSHKQTELIDNKTISGKWRSESDSKYTLIFKKEKYIELYSEDTTDNMYYKLSGSCNLKDSSSKVNLQKAFLLFYFNNGSVQQCNEILSLKSDVLSWMNNTNGKIFVFRKVK